MKLWKKEHELDKQIEKFTVGDDPFLDLQLIKYDCLASIAHAKMLFKINVLNDAELDQLTTGLNEIILLASEDKFPISTEDEDCHTAIENFLTAKYGQVGKKIHTGRSRNDQVLTAIRLYEKEELLSIKKLLDQFKLQLKIVCDRSGKIKIPGYTHMQRAMPTSVSVWATSFFDSALDNIRLLNGIFEIIDQSPLGTAAGYGVPVLEIDRDFTAELMNFSRVMENPIYAQLSRGKFESGIIHLCSQIMYDLNKLASDLILYNMVEFGFVSLPEDFCTGSSIMPQKKNPDVLELVRTKYHLVLGEEFKVKSMMSNLISGYNRDLQLTKGPLLLSIETTKDSLQIMSLVLNGMEFLEKNCANAMTDELFATERAYELVKSGVPFREAYQKVAKDLK